MYVVSMMGFGTRHIPLSQQRIHERRARCHVYAAEYIHRLIKRCTYVFRSNNTNYISPAEYTVYAYTSPNRWLQLYATA